MGISGSRMRVCLKPMRAATLDRAGSEAVNGGYPVADTRRKSNYDPYPTVTITTVYTGFTTRQAYHSKGSFHQKVRGFKTRAEGLGVLVHHVTSPDTLNAHARADRTSRMCPGLPQQHTWTWASAGCCIRPTHTQASVRGHLYPNCSGKSSFLAMGSITVLLWPSMDARWRPGSHLVLVLRYLRYYCSR